MNEYEQIQTHLNELLQSLGHLKRLGVLCNKKDLTSQLGEFLIARLYNGRLASNSIQKDWDIQLPNGNYLQVKTHAKAATNNNRWTSLNYEVDALITNLIIVVFTEDYKLKDIYNIPWKVAYELSTLDKTRRLLRWNRLDEYRIKINALPNQDLIRLFT